jgi:hypothetical protein
MKTWNEILKESEKLLDVKFYITPNKQIKIKTTYCSEWWWYCDLTKDDITNKETFQNLVNRDLSDRKNYLSLLYK